MTYIPPAVRSIPFDETQGAPPALASNQPTVASSNRDSDEPGAPGRSPTRGPEPLRPGAPLPLRLVVAKRWDPPFELWTAECPHCDSTIKVTPGEPRVCSCCGFLFKPVLQRPAPVPA